MRKKAKAKRAATYGRYPSRADVRAFSKVQSVVEADHLVNTDLNELSGALEYWSKASTSHVVWPQTPDTRTKLHTRTKPRRIETLVISARDDFLLDAKSYPVADAIDDTITFDFPANGSHIGFVPRGSNKDIYWSESRTIDWLRDDAK